MLLLNWSASALRKNEGNIKYAYFYSGDLKRKLNSIKYNISKNKTLRFNG